MDCTVFECDSTRIDTVDGRTGGLADFFFHTRTDGRTDGRTDPSIDPSTSTVIGKNRPAFSAQYLAYEEKQWNSKSKLTNVPPNEFTFQNINYSKRVVSSE